MSIGDLKIKLQARISEDRKTLEQITQNEFENLQRSLSESSKNALNTIKADIAAQAEAMSEVVTNKLQRLEQQTEKLQNTLVSSWLKSATLGACLMFGLTLGAWGLSAAASGYVQGQWSQISELQREKENLQETVALLEQKTWGIQLLETTKGRFILLPKKATAKTGWTMNDRDAIKLEQ